MATGAIEAWPRIISMVMMAKVFTILLLIQVSYYQRIMMIGPFLWLIDWLIDCCVCERQPLANAFMIPTRWTTTVANDAAMQRNTKSNLIMQAAGGVSSPVQSVVLLISSHLISSHLIPHIKGDRRCVCGLIGWRCWETYESWST